MADILIQGMDKPKSCNACMFDVYGLCLINKYLEAEDELTHDCPLVEVPEHGDLIDASKLIPIYEEMKWSDDYCKECMKGAIWEVEQAPVIVPSNKEETE